MTPQSTVQVKFRQSGGVTGVLRGCDLNTSELPANEAQELRELLDQSLPSKTNAPAKLRDGSDYDLTVTVDGVTQTFQFATGAVGEAVKPLLRFLRKHSGPVGKD